MTVSLEAAIAFAGLVLAILIHAYVIGSKLGRIETLVTAMLPEISSLRTAKHEHANVLTAHETRLEALERLHEREGTL